MEERELATLLSERARVRSRVDRGCPESEQLAGLATDDLPKATRDSLLGHVESCPDCATELAAAMAASELVAGSSTASVVPFRRPVGIERSPARSRWLALAAAFVLAATAVVTYRAFEAPAAELRGGEPGAWAVTPPDGAELTAPPRTLEWPAAAEARGYSVELFDAAFTRLARAGDLARPRFELPPELLLPPGAVYFWRVEVAGANGSERSRVFSFRLAG